MNILPKKRWHVRTKDNIARVRRDEAQAAEEEKKRQMRIQIAEREARTEALRKKAREEYGSKIPLESSPKAKAPPLDSSSDKHVNLFYELDHNEVVSNKTNEEYEKEKKLEKEKYEKQIGYLTYLGQDTNEITGQVSWYNKPKEEISNNQEEVSKKQKVFEDPLEDIKKYLNCNGIQRVKESVKVEKTETKDLIRKWKLSDSDNLKHKKHKKEKKSKHKKKKKHSRKKHSSDSDSDSESEVKVKNEKKIDLERLRAERIRREKEERRRADELFARLNGVEVKKKEDKPETSQRYNSQFNPHLAKQNFIG